MSMGWATRVLSKNVLNLKWRNSKCIHSSNSQTVVRRQKRRCWNLSSGAFVSAAKQLTSINNQIHHGINHWQGNAEQQRIEKAVYVEAAHQEVGQLHDDDVNDQQEKAQREHSDGKTQNFENGLHHRVEQAEHDH